MSMMRDQTPNEDMLVDRGVEDQLDEGYSPPERRPATHDVGTTAQELHDGETWDQRLAQEVPEPDPYELAAKDDTTTWTGDGTEQPRAGRLMAPDQGAHEDADKDEVAFDVGIDGGAASAEEAAMHIVEEDVVVADAMDEDVLEERPL
ncbi:MAG TPA: DUF5709 domain-containing protein [Mycobacteriales bacterium]|nr:DUF5709 domain-containing protein [Mycobacteriales bacterium]